jgi:hypothetical protein
VSVSSPDEIAAGSSNTCFRGCCSVRFLDYFHSMQQCSFDQGKGKRNDPCYTTSGSRTKGRWNGSEDRVYVEDCLSYLTSVLAGSRACQQGNIFVLMLDRTTLVTRTMKYLAPAPEYRRATYSMIGGQMRDVQQHGKSSIILCIFLFVICCNAIVQVRSSK